MIRVLFIVPSLKRAGAETQIIDMVNALQDAGIERHLLSFGQELDQLERVKCDEVSFHHALRRSKYDTKYIRDIAKIIDEKQIDVVHCTLQFSLLVAWLARARSRRKPKMVAAIHTTQNLGMKEELQDRLIYQWLLRRCDAIIFVCKQQAGYWYRRYPMLRAKSAVVYNGVDVGSYDPGHYTEKGISLRRAHSIPENAFVVSCIAGFRPEKGHINLIKAFSYLPDNSYLMLAGDGKTRSEAESIVAAMGLSDRVFFLGNLSDVRPLLAASSITVLASTAVETFSIAMLESMAMKVPMLASDIGGLSEAIRPGKTGYLVAPGNISELAASLEKMSGDPQAVVDMGDSARKLVESEFSTQAMARETQKVLINTLHGRGVAHA